MRNRQVFATCGASYSLSCLRELGWVFLHTKMGPLTASFPAIRRYDTGMSNPSLRRVVGVVAATGFAAVVFVGVGVGLRGLSALQSARDFLANPLRLSQRVMPTGPVVLEQVQRLQRLETCRYNGQVVVRGDTQGILPKWLAGDRMLFVGRGEVVAGIDLARLGPNDVVVQGDEVTVRLPQAEILHSALDSRRSQVFEHKSGIFTGPDPQLETKVRIQAEDQIRDAALESGLLNTARQNAEAALRDHLRPLGFREIRFSAI